MEELPVVVEGIGNKVKKLIIRNKQLRDRLVQADGEKSEMLKRIEAQARQIMELEGRIASLEIAKTVGKGDLILARQKVHDLLREIEKCQVLLNR